MSHVRSLIAGLGIHLAVGIEPKRDDALIAELFKDLGYQAFPLPETPVDPPVK